LIVFLFSIVPLLTLKLILLSAIGEILEADVRLVLFRACNKRADIPVRASAIAEGDDAPADSVLLGRGRGSHEVLVDLRVLWHGHEKVSDSAMFEKKKKEKKKPSPNHVPPPVK
jgi:hypothetical protein